MEVRLLPQSQIWPTLGCFVLLCFSFQPQLLHAWCALAVSIIRKQDSGRPLALSTRRSELPLLAPQTPPNSLGGISLLSAPQLPAFGCCQPLCLHVPRFSFKLQLPERCYHLSGSGFAGREGAREKLGNPDSCQMKLSKRSKEIT